MELENYKTFNPDKHLIIADGPINEPLFIDTTVPSPKIYNLLPGNRKWKVNCIADSCGDLFKLNLELETRNPEPYAQNNNSRS